MCKILHMNSHIKTVSKNRELSVQAANGTNSYSDRQSIPPDVLQIVSEMQSLN